MPKTNIRDIHSSTTTKVESEYQEFKSFQIDKPQKTAQTSIPIEDMKVIVIRNGKQPDEIEITINVRQHSEAKRIRHLNDLLKGRD